MASKTELKRIASAVVGIGGAIANTFVEQAGVIADTCHAVYGGSTDIPKEEMEAIQNAVAEDSAWKGTSSEGARRSEVKAIVGAYPWLKVATQVFKREFGELRREHFVKLARMCPEYVTPTDAALDCVAFFESRGKSGSKGASKTATPAQKIASSFKTIIDTTNDAKLKQALYRLVKAHSIKLPA